MTLHITDADGQSFTATAPITVDLEDTPPPPPPPPPPDASECLIAQILREPTNRRGDPKDAFDIIVNNLDLGVNMWTAPYVVDLATKGFPEGYGWISGDRGGYKGAYMFLVDGIGDPETARIIGRVTFAQAPGAEAYVQINDREMDEIRTTHLTFAGGCDPDARQDQQPHPMTDIDYEPNTGPDVRPLIRYTLTNGLVIEDRSYTNTQAPAQVKFGEHERITEPFTQRDGVGGTHIVYQRVTVVAYWDDLPAAIVYYDTLVPDVTIT